MNRAGFAAALACGLLMFAVDAAAQGRTVRLADGATLDMAWIPPGTFTMGSTASESGRHSDESPRTIVTLSHGFWLGRTHVTVGQWKRVMGRGVREQLLRVIDDDSLHELGGKPQTLRAFMHFSRNAADEYLANEDDDLPMYFVSWNDAVEFCRRLNTAEKAAGRLPAGYEFDLPTEAQWEYAARAGHSDEIHAGSFDPRADRIRALDEMAWYDGNSADGYRGRGLKLASGLTAGPRAVALKRPNAWRLYDMAGNVWQWCRDWYGPYPGGKVIDPQGPPAGAARVNRGGSFGSSAGDARPANRANNPQVEASAYRGFRLALVAR